MASNLNLDGGIVSFRSLGAALTAGILTLSSSAQALLLECKNAATEPISVAVSYLDYDGKTWMVEGWYSLQAGERANIELDSSNDIFYIYGEFAGGSEVKGGSGSLDLPVYFRTFKYIQGQNSIRPDKVVSFVRGVAANGSAQISFGPIQSR